MDITYRQEQAADYEGISKVHDSATNSNTNSTLIQNLRLTTNFITELSIVAEHKGEIVGHALFYPVRINSGAIRFATLYVAAISVLQRVAKKYVEENLLKEGIQIATKKDFTSIIAHSKCEEYRTLGFVPSKNWNITAPFECEDEAFIVKEIKENGGLGGVKGVVCFPKEFCK